MRFFSLLAGAAAFATAVLAQDPGDDSLRFLSVPANFQAGETVTITYASPNPDEVC